MGDQQCVLAGLDLAWQAEKNPSALALGCVQQNALKVTHLYPALVGVETLLQTLLLSPNLRGIAIDAPLVITNEYGQRPCEHALARDYAARRAACHPTNLQLYPNASSVSLSQQLLQFGFDYRPGERWQFECYPHPAIVECFALPERLLYKKGTVADKRAGQQQLAMHLLSLARSPVLPLQLADDLPVALQADEIARLRGRALKQNEDALDAIVCVYIAALYAIGATGRWYGDVEHGCIWVPQGSCLPTKGAL